MRSRPKVTVLLHPGKVIPGEDLVAEVVLKSRSRTPVDFVHVALRGERFSTVENVPWSEIVYKYDYTSRPFVLEEGDDRVKVRFAIPPDLPPTYDGGTVKCEYALHVHVAIPWWADRHETFVVPVVFPPAPVPAGVPAIYTNAQTPTIELALDTTSIVAGETLNGSISIQKLGGRTLRGVEIAFVETETIHGTQVHRHESRRYRMRVFDGAPEDGESIPFRVRVPPQCTPSFVSGPLELRTYLHARALVAWGEDIVLRTRLVVYPTTSSPSDTKGSVAPVGTERQRRVWEAVAARYEAHVDKDTRRMQLRKGNVAIEIRAEPRGTEPWLVAELGWPDLGLDLSIRERKWSDLLAHARVPTGDSAIDERVAAHAREVAQAARIVTPNVLKTVLPFAMIEIDDDGARLALPEPASDALEGFVRLTLAAAVAFGEVLDAVPPPALYVNDVVAWEAFAERLGGRLERGRMSIRDGHIGLDAVAVESMWSRNGLLVGTTVKVAIDPPLESQPRAPEDPAISPSARDAWNELLQRVKALRVETDAIELMVEGKLADPQTAMPLLELAVALRRALGHVRAAGPFR